MNVTSIAFAAGMKKASQADDDRKSTRREGALLGALPLGFAATIPLGFMNERLVKGMRAGDIKATSRREIAAMKRHMGINPRVHSAKEMMESRAMPRGGISHAGLDAERAAFVGEKIFTKAQYDRAVKGKGAVIVGRHHPEVIAHELGHIWMRKNPAIAAALRKTLAPAKQIGTLGGYGMALAGSRGSVVVKAAPLVAALGQMPHLIDEAGASLKALHTMKSLGYSPAQMSAARGMLGRAYGTYLLNAAAHVLPVAAMSAWRWNKAKKDEKK